MYLRLYFSQGFLNTFFSFLLIYGGFGVGVVDGFFGDGALYINTEEKTWEQSMRVCDIFVHMIIHTSRHTTPV